MGFSPEYDELAQKVRNWGRWGDDDQRGTLNLIDDAAILRAAACVRRGVSFSLAVDLAENGIQMGQPAGRFNATLTPTALNERDKHAPGIWEGTDDLVTMSTCAGTHVDSLSHVGYRNQLYGGRDQHETVKARGLAKELGAEHIGPVVSRGLLIDVPRTRGVDELDAGTAVTADDLDAAVSAGGVTVEPGDLVCVRTGEIRQYLSGDRTRYATGVDWKNTGLGVSCVEWFRDRDVAGVFLDCYTYEVMPPEPIREGAPENWDDLMVVHLLQLVEMGMLQGQNWNFEALSEDCAADGRIDFMLVVAPEPLVGATSSPVNPVAVR
jgi:kynurenine formamidase